MSPAQWLRLTVPGIVIFAAGQAWSLKPMGEKTPWRPPPWVFGAAWALLTGLIGLAWAGQPSDAVPPLMRDSIFIALVAVLASFAPITKIQGARAGPAICSGSVALAIAAVLVTRQPHALALAPLLGWLVFAALLSADAAREEP
jgi:tryptophan-rich sensory protein